MQKETVFAYRFIQTIQSLLGKGEEYEGTARMQGGHRTC